MGERFASNENGSAGVVFGIALLAVVIGVGVGIDYVQAVNERVMLINAADAAVLSGASTARAEIGAGNENWQTKSQASAVADFTANLPARVKAHLSSSKASYSLAATQLRGQVAFVANVPTYFGKIVGLNKIAVGGTSAAATTIKKFTDIHIVVDTSTSMGIGATPADQTTLLNTIGCQVACHYRTNGNGPDNLAAARASGATLRIDVVKNALAQAIATIKPDGSTRVAIYTLGNTLTTAFPLSTDIAGATAALKNLELTQATAEGGTNIGYSMTQLAGMLQAAGAGTSSKSPSGVVILATDAVEDETIVYKNPGPDTWTTDPNFVINPISVADGSGMHFQTFDPAKCSAVKAKNYDMFTLEVAYIIPSPTDPWYNTRLDFIKNNLLPTEIPRAMSQCASTPSQYFHAETSADIAKAVQQLFPAATGLRLTQ